MKPKLCAVYICREPESVWPFISSWLRHHPGLPCSLVVADKWGHSAPLVDCAEIVTAPDRILGLGTFRRVTDRRSEEFFCLLNSSSIIRCDGWLERLYREASKPSVGLAGCTGSWESFLSNNPARWRELMHWQFPNPHIRTNAFVIRRDLLRACIPRWVLFKPHEHWIESGKGGITRKAIELGFNPVVVTEGVTLDRDGWQGNAAPMVSDRRQREKAAAAKL